MKIQEVMTYIEALAEDAVIFSSHAKKRMNFRKISKETIINSIKHGKKVGILVQNSQYNVYKLIVELSPYIDLNIIFRLYEQRARISIITLFKSETSRRKKNEK